jgi:hypothetical protein
MIASKNWGFLTADDMSSALVISLSMVLRIWLWMTLGVLRISTKNKIKQFVGFGVRIFVL